MSVTARNGDDDFFLALSRSGSVVVRIGSISSDPSPRLCGLRSLGEKMAVVYAQQYLALPSMH
jgi:hypothetical protein